MHLANSTEHTYFTTRKGTPYSALLDPAILSSTLITKLANYNLIKECTSDQLLQLQTRLNIPSAPKELKIKRINWDTFHRQIENYHQLRAIETNRQLNEATQHITTAIQSAVTTAIITTAKLNNHTKQYTLPHYILTQIKTSRKTRKLYQKLGTQQPKEYSKNNKDK
eukprot:Pgem_evm1s6706